MNIIAYDTPVFWAVLLLLAYVLFRYGYQRFILAMHSAVTFGSQFSFIVNWSFGKVLPFLAIPYAFKKGKTGLVIFSGFVGFVFINTLVQSFFWQIPPGVKFAYGEGRFIIQLVNFTLSILITRATVLALNDRSQVEIFWRFFTYAILAHGIASLYQLIAVSFGLPLLGISRPFDLVMEGQIADVAIFGIDSGQSVYRPGGLAGEPKGIAVLYGIYLTGYLFGGAEISKTNGVGTLAKITFILALIGFIAAFSTSAFIGIVPIALVCLYVWGVGKFTKTAFYLVLFLTLAIALWSMTTSISLDDFYQIIGLRTTGRFQSEQLDAPVAASIHAFFNNPLITLIGTGAGGSSFIIMEYLNQTFDYAYAANIGFVFLLVEYGVIGSILFVLPYGYVFMKAAAKSKRTRDPSIVLLCSVSISAFAFCMVGSGYSFGFPLAIAAAAAALRIPTGKSS